MEEERKKRRKRKIQCIILVIRVDVHIRVVHVGSVVKMSEDVGRSYEENRGENPNNYIPVRIGDIRLFAQTLFSMSAGRDLVACGDGGAVFIPSQDKPFRCGKYEPADEITSEQFEEIKNRDIIIDMEE